MNGFISFKQYTNIYRDCFLQIPCGLEIIRFSINREFSSFSSLNKISKIPIS